MKSSDLRDRKAIWKRTLNIYKCPMWPKPGQTSHWLLLQGPLKNPFYGAEMLDCGSEVTP